MDKRTYFITCVSAAVVGFLLLALHLVIPMPKPGRMATKLQAQENKLKDEIEVGRKQTTERRAANEKRVWAERVDQMGPKLMALVSKEAQKQGLKVVAFRPQRTEEVAGLTRTPYLVSLEGRFPQLIAFAKGLETPANRVVVTNIQCAASDGESDAVTGSVGIVAFVGQTEKQDGQ